MNNQWKVSTEGDIEQIVENHSALLSGDAIVTIVDAIPIGFTVISARLLRAIVRYHLTHQAKDGEKDWKGAYEEFASLCNSTGVSQLVAFYIENYCFLSARNAELNADVIVSHFKTASGVAEKIEQPLRDQLEGFLFYNYSRWLIKEGRMEEAFDYYNKAKKARIIWYVKVAESQSPEEEILKAAATQVWKMHHDFEKLFPGRSALELYMPPELIREVSTIADPNFSAAK